jgi:intergrase/recombinase
VDKTTTTTTYYKPERQALEHFRFPQVFFRQTKKAYISFVSPEILEIAKFPSRNAVPSHNAIRHACNKRGLPCNLHLCRKVFASWLHEYGGIPDITVDMLQGRVGKSVLVNHYLTPDSSLKDRVLTALHGLKAELER